MRHSILLMIVLLGMSCENNRLDTLKTFYSNGILRAERQYKIERGDTIFHGYGKLYYPSANTKCEIWFKNGLQDGVATWYYDDKDKLIESESIWKNGLEVGEVREYYESSKIKGYYYNNDQGETSYVREYSELGEMIFEEGHGIPVKTGYVGDYRRLDTLKMHLAMVSPPNVKRYFYFGIRSKTGELLNKREVDLPTDQTVFTYTKILEESGQFIYGGLLLLVDQISNDTSRYEVIVPNIVVD